MADITLVYLPNRGCFALKIVKKYNDIPLFYTQKDELIRSSDLPNVELENLVRRYFPGDYARIYGDTEPQSENARTMIDSVEVLPDSGARSGLSFFVTDPDYRSTLNMLQQKAGKNKRGTNAGIPDPEDPKNWRIRIDIKDELRQCESSCKCSVYSCKHKVAVAEYCRLKQQELEEAYIHTRQQVDKGLFITNGLKKMIDNTFEEAPDLIDPDRIGLLKRIVGEILSAGSLQYFDAVLKYLIWLHPYDFDYDARLLECYSPLIGAFYMEPSFRERMQPEMLDKLLNDYYYYNRQGKSNVVTLKRELKHYQSAEKDLNKGKMDDSMYHLFLLKYSDDSDRLLQFYAESDQMLYGDDLAFLTLYMDDFKKMPDPLSMRIVKKVDLAHEECRKERDELIPKLLSVFPPQQQAVLIAHLEHYNLDIASYRNLPKELQEELAEHMQPTTENLQYILENVTKDWDDKRKAGLILKLGRQIFDLRSKSQEGTYLIAAVKKLENHGLLELYLQGIFNPKNGIPKKGSLEINDADVTAYFSTDFLIREEKGKPETDIYLFASGEEPDRDRLKQLPAETAREMYKSRARFRFSEKDGKMFATDQIGIALSEGSLKRIAGLALEGRAEESQKEKRELQEAIEFRGFEKKNQHFANMYRRLCKELKGEKIILEDSYKANLTYMFDFSGDIPLLCFKVGNTRDYIVKNGNDFLQAFRSGETITYGKDLVLTHDIENLKEEDRPVIRLLSPMKFHVIGTGPQAKRFLPLSGTLLSNVIELLKGRKVLVGENETLVRLSQEEVKLEIDRKYRLKVLLDRERRQLLFSGNRIYLFSRNPDGLSTIDLVKADPAQIRLIMFVLEGGEVSIRPILNDFKRNIYSRFYDMFRVDDSIRKDFVLSVIRINAYFDYDGKAITLKTEYRKGEEAISRSAITERMDLAKAEAFETTLQGLGFENSCLRDESRILSFFKMDFSGLKKQASIYLSEAITSKKLSSVNRQVIRISCSKSGIIDAMLEQSDFSEEELDLILRAMKKKKKFILLTDDRIVDLDSREAREFRDTVRDLGLESGELYKKKRLSMVEALKAFAHENSCSIDRQLRHMLDEVRTFKEFEAKPPKLSYEMRSYQEEGFRWLSVLSKYNMGGVLADDMGLGKTLQIIALIKADRTKKPSLIVCPKSLVFNWINEFAKFDGETSVEEIYGLSDRRKEIINGIDFGEKKVFVTSYDSLRNDIEYYDGTFNYCILDEAQYIKNVAAQKSRSAKEIKAEHRFALTGTPIENNILDLWSIFDFIMPGYFEALSEFKASAAEEEFHENVAKRIGPFVLRRIKENVLADLPEKYETVLSCEMTAPQKKAYEALRKTARDAMASGGKAFDMLPMLMQLRQVCVDPALCMDGYDGGSGKLAALTEMIPSYLNQGHRILIFSQFVKGLNRVEGMLKEAGIPYFLLTGDTPAKERSRMIDEFNSTEGTDVFLISLKAGGTGLNLIGADTVIHLDPWWNAAAENQATDRAHRIGQTKNVEVIKLISEDSIEQRVIELQNQKKNLIDRVISNDESSVTGASLEDIAYILK